MKYHVCACVTVVVNGVMLPAEDLIMTSSTDEPTADADEHYPLWISRISVAYIHYTSHSQSINQSSLLFQAARPIHKNNNNDDEKVETIKNYT